MLIGTFSNQGLLALSRKHRVYTFNQFSKKNSSFLESLEDGNSLLLNVLLGREGHQLKNLSFDANEQEPFSRGKNFTNFEEDRIELIQKINDFELMKKQLEELEQREFSFNEPQVKVQDKSSKNQLQMFSKDTLNHHRKMHSIHENFLKNLLNIFNTEKVKTSIEENEGIHTIFTIKDSPQTSDKKEIDAKIEEETLAKRILNGTTNE